MNMHGTNRPPFTVDCPSCGLLDCICKDIQDVSERHKRCPDCGTTSDAHNILCGYRPFALPADSVEITLDLPMPVSTNKLYDRSRKGGVRKSVQYVRWMQEADMTVVAAKAYPRRKITGPYEMELLLSREHRGDGSNRIKALEDWLQSRDIIRNDSDCRRGSWEWVEPERAPKGCRVVVRSLHEAVR